MDFVLLRYDRHYVWLCDVIPQGQPVTGEYYSQVLRNPLKTKLAQNRPHYATTGWILHHDNTPAQRAQVTKRVIDKLGVESIARHHNSPGPPATFIYSLKLKRCSMNRDLLPMMTLTMLWWIYWTDCQKNVRNSTQKEDWVVRQLYSAAGKVLWGILSIVTYVCFFRLV